MNMLKCIIICLILNLIIFSCTNNKFKANYVLTNRDRNVRKLKKDRDTIPVQDTTIILNNLLTLKSNSNVNLTNEMIEHKINTYFEKKGYYSPENVNVDDSSKLCVQSGNSFFVNINNDKYPDAIIQYYLIPWMASSSSFFPHKAIMISNANDYLITCEDFIPEQGYAIDSIKQKNSEIIIYAYVYDWIEHKTVKYVDYKLIIK